MSAKAYFDELERALARPDADQMCQQLDAYADHLANHKSAKWPEEYAEDFGEIISCFFDDPEKAFAYVILAASRSDDTGFLGRMAAGNLEDVLEDPSDELLDRIVSEARKSERFRWMLSIPYKVAIAPKAWEAIEQFRISPDDTLPPRN